MRSRLLFCVLAFVLVFASLAEARSRPRLSRRGAEAVAAELDRAARDAVVPANFGLRGLRVESAERGRARVRIDVGEEIASLESEAEIEALLDSVMDAAGRSLPRRFRDVDYDILVGGRPLPELFPREEAASSEAASVHDGSASVSAKRIALSPGHGWYWRNATTGWTLQRSYFFGIVEDFVNWELAALVQSRLAAAGAAVLPARNMSKTAGNGVSGKPKWQEGARCFFQSQGLPQSIWNESGYTQLDQDLRSRPRYANHAGADILVSIHNNGGGGSGSEVWYDSANGQQAASARLADAVRTSIVSAIRGSYLASWTDRGTKSCNGCKGENRIATRPAIIVELAFMDRQTPDNAALQSASFRALVADAISRGIQSYYGAATPTLKNRLANPGFESGATGWVQSGSVITSSTLARARTGSWYGWLGGGNNLAESVTQDVLVPANATKAEFSYWYQSSTAETAASCPSGCCDAMALEVRRASDNAVLAGPLASVCNSNVTAWTRSAVVNLLPYKGQTLRLRLMARTGSAAASSFFVDDLALMADGS